MNNTKSVFYREYNVQCILASVMCTVQCTLHSVAPVLPQCYPSVACLPTMLLLVMGTCLKYPGCLKLYCIVLYCIVL